MDLALRDSSIEWKGPSGASKLFLWEVEKNNFIKAAQLLLSNMEVSLTLDVTVNE